MGKGDVKKILEERERRKRSDLAWKLVNDWRIGKIEGLSPYAMKAVQTASKRNQDYMTRPTIDAQELHNYAEECAYYIATQQPNPYREICLPSHEKKMTCWRGAQFVLLLLMTTGPLTMAIAISTGDFKPSAFTEQLVCITIVISFLAYVTVSSWCNHCKQWYSQYQRETATLNALVTTDMIVSILRSKAFADRMRKELASPNGPYKKELKAYLSWLYPED